MIAGPCQSTKNVCPHDLTTTLHDCSLTYVILSDFSRSDYQGPPIKNLLEVVEYVKPTALLGLSTVSVSVAGTHVWPNI
jgi:hypothetical protein